MTILILDIISSLVCVQDMKCIFGEIANEEMKLNDFGKIVSESLKKIPIIHNNIELDYHVIMPNHIHAIIIVGDAKICIPYIEKCPAGYSENDCSN